MFHIKCLYSEWKASKKAKAVVLDFWHNSGTKIYMIRGHCRICSVIYFIEALVFELLKKDVESEQILRVNYAELQDYIIEHIRIGNRTISNLFYGNKLLILENIDLMTSISCQREFERYLELTYKKNKKRLIVLTTKSQSEFKLPKDVECIELDV